MVQAMVLIFSQYPESTLKVIVNPLEGLPSKFKFLPGVMEFGAACAEISAAVELQKQRIADHERKVYYQALPAPERPAEKGCYEGPIELVKPGDILSWERHAEYRAYMEAKHGFDPGRAVDPKNWMDSGRRPFDTLSGKHSANQNQSTEEPNPFDIS